MNAFPANILTNDNLSAWRLMRGPKKIGGYVMLIKIILLLSALIALGIWALRC